MTNPEASAISALVATIAATQTITIDADTARGPVRLELTRDQTLALARQLSAAWLP